MPSYCSVLISGIEVKWKGLLFMGKVSRSPFKFLLLDHTVVPKVRQQQVV